MRILFLCRRFYPDIGGVEKHVWEISLRLAKSGHKVMIVTQSQNLQREVVLKNITIVRIPKNVQTKFQLWKWFWQNRYIIEDADIIHCHDVFYWYLPFRFIYPRKHVFTTFHGYESYPIKKKAIIVRKLSELLSFGNICVGDFIKKWYYTKPTVVSYGAVDSSQFKTKTQKKKIFKESALFFGRLDVQTGIQTYNKAFEILKKKYPKFRLLVVGDGKYRRFLANKIQVKGFQKNPEQYFENYRFAFVSRYLSILEAFAAKRLVFAVYDNPVKEDYLRMTPFAKYMIIAKTPAELARKVQFFITHPDLEKKLVEQAYTWVKKQSWSGMVNIYLRLWKST
ncbi:MAG TPA: glycosyltransferase family 4 protein [Patescibacteria group bacterium]|nr:glycosyltransferase family 4 protein [Patescibacteria group bacterium]